MQYTDTQVIHNPYSTPGSAVAHTRGTGYTPSAVTTTDDTVTINAGGIVPEYIDRADMAQKTFDGWMAIAEDQATSLKEYLETAMLAAHAGWTDFTNASIGGAAGTITVSESNIEDIITGIKREIRKAKGGKRANRNGIFIIWTPDQFELLEKYAAAQGFSTADRILINGADRGFKLFGIEHYYSNLIAAGHAFGGVKKMMTCGICKSTFGQVYEIEDPVVSGAQISGIGIISRIDFGFETWVNSKPVLFDINYT